MGALGVALGPVVGGALVAVAGWRWIFLVNVPVCALTVVLLRRHVAESPPDPARRTDLAGLLLGVAALAGLTAGFITAGGRGWLAPLPGALLGAGLLGALFAGSGTSGRGMTLHLPLTVAAIGYLLAIGLTLAIRAEK